LEVAEIDSIEVPGSFPTFTWFKLPFDWRRGAEGKLPQSARVRQSR
jgi:hypothetical protein